MQKFCTASNKEVYVGFPWLHEGFPMYFEDRFSIYSLYGDAQSNRYTIQRSDQFRSTEEWNGLVNRMRHNLIEQGIFCHKERVNVMVTANRIAGVDCYNDLKEYYFYKTYMDQAEMVPLSLIVRKRDPKHCWDVNLRVNSPEQELVKNQQVICLNLNMFGLVGAVQHVDARRGQIKVGFNRATEEKKTHDPFMGQRHLEQEHKKIQGSNERIKTFFGDQEIDRMLGVKSGVVSRITSSFLIAYKSLETHEKQVVDIGLNIKNWSKRLHIPKYVRFVSNADQVSNNQHDGYNHNHHARGAKHVRSHWEYSNDCVDILREFHEKFPSAFDCVHKTRNNKTAVQKLSDLYPGDLPEAVGKLKILVKWVEGLAMSNIPFVNMGFDTLDKELIKSMDQVREDIAANYQPIKLQVKNAENL